jgi:hypothetical protein
MKRWIRIIIIATLFGLIGGALVYFAGGYFNRDRNIALAREHAAKLHPILMSDDRFRQIEATDFYRWGGVLLVFGEVDTQRDFNDLQQIVSGSSPPVSVRYDVEVKSK